MAQKADLTRRLSYFCPYLHTCTYFACTARWYLWNPLVSGWGMMGTEESKMVYDISTKICYEISSSIYVLVVLLVPLVQNSFRYWEWEYVKEPNIILPVLFSCGACLESISVQWPSCSATHLVFSTSRHNCSFQVAKSSIVSLVTILMPGACKTSAFGGKNTRIPDVPACFPWLEATLTSRRDHGQSSHPAPTDPSSLVSMSLVHFPAY